MVSIQHITGCIPACLAVDCIAVHLGCAHAPQYAVAAEFWIMGNSPATAKPAKWAGSSHAGEAGAARSAGWIGTFELGCWLSAQGSLSRRGAAPQAKNAVVHEAR